MRYWYLGQWLSWLNHSTGFRSAVLYYSKVSLQHLFEPFIFFSSFHTPPHRGMFQCLYVVIRIRCSRPKVTIIAQLYFQMFPLAGLPTFAERYTMPSSLPEGKRVIQGSRHTWGDEDWSQMEHGNWDEKMVVNIISRHSPGSWGDCVWLIPQRVLEGFL